MKAVDVIAVVLVIVGALNWGLVGAANFNLVPRCSARARWRQSCTSWSA